MRKGWCRLAGGLALVVAVVGLVAVGSHGVDASAGLPAADPVGGRKFFFCAMGQTLKYIGIFTGNVTLALTGAIGGGIACGMGW